MAFGSLPLGTAESVAAEWLVRAGKAKQHGAAHRLYGGAGWSQSLRAWQVVKAQKGELFIASAGFGLLRSDEIVPPYAATFSPEDDRIAGTLSGYDSTGEAHRAWWAAINKVRLNTAKPLCQSLRGFDCVVAALSAHYFRAVRDDLTALAEKMGPKKLFVVATGVAEAEVPEVLWACFLSIGVTVEGLLNGPRATLNQRALVWLLEEIVPRSGWERAAVEKEIRRRLQNLRPVEQNLKQRLSDDQIQKWIRQQWQKEPKLGRTELLRRLRNAGYSCEQKRFSEIVAGMEKENAGQVELDLKR
ncbi:MAG TPA: hypothetical protein VF600_17435 [Abditibacteriaceae bacterium]